MVASRRNNFIRGSLYMYKKMSKKERRRLNRKLRRLRNDKSIVRDYRLYALSLADNKYYVGLTAYKDVTRRFNAHLNGRTAGGAKWTSAHKPLAILEVREIGKTSKRNAEAAETSMTLEYIEKFGLENVRGGELCAVNGYIHLKAYAKLKSREKYIQVSNVVITRERTIERIPMAKPEQPIDVTAATQ